MRIAIVTSSYWPIIGGQMIYARDLARELVRQGHEVTVATRFTSRLRENTWESLSDVDPAASYEEEGVKVRVLRPRGLRRLALYPVHRLHYYERTEETAIRLCEVAFMDALDEAIGPCDVIHFNGVGREMFGFCAASLARKRGAPFILTTHVHPGTWGDSGLDFRLYGKADQILAHTEWEKRFYVERGVAPERVRVVGIGVKTAGNGDRARGRAAHGLSGPSVLFMARKAQYKGYGLLLESAPIVWDHVPDAHFVLVGPDQDEPTAEQRRILRDPRVRSLSAVTEHGVKEDLYAAGDVFCMPSTAESFGIVYIEAWRYGCPVIALDLPPLRELIEGCGGGITLSERSPDAVAGAIVRLLGDRSMRETMGARGRTRSLDFELERIAEQIACIYGECAADVAGGGRDARREEM